MSEYGDVLTAVGTLILAGLAYLCGRFLPRLRLRREINRRPYNWSTDGL